MASTSSLLKSAAATRKKVRQQEDALRAFQWESSAQTRADYEDYRAYIENRLETTTDPSEQLTYMSKERTIRRSFVSNELQREQMRIMQGSGTTQTKMDAIQSLYDEALDNQDFNLAQNLASQWSTLSIQAQNEAEAGARAFAASSTKQKNDFMDTLLKGYDDVTLPNGQKVSGLNAIKDAFTETGDIVGLSQAARDTLEAAAAAVIDQYNSATTQEEITKLEQKYGPGLEKLGEELFIKMGGQTLTYQDLENTIANDRFNNPLYGLKATYNESTGQTEYNLQKNNVESIDYIRRINEAGDEEYLPAGIRTSQDSLFFGTSDVGRGLNAQLTNEGSVIGNGDDTGSINMGQETVNRDDSQTIGNRLKNLGIEARMNGTTLVIKLPGENVERMATIEPDGSIRYFGEDGSVNEIGLVDRNLGTNDLPQFFPAGQSRVVDVDEVSDFGTRGVAGQLSTPSLQGQRYISDILGKTKAPAVLNLNTPIRVGNDFSGFGTSVTSSLLQTAGYRQKQIQLQQQAAQAAARLQQAASLQGGFSLQGGGMPNLNQTPVQQLTNSGLLKRQLRVMPIQTPRIVVRQAPAQPSIRVSSPAATPRINIGPAPATPRLRVR